eukprot:CAMPEP_0182535918 /NCGR_PEP_ID=MMETSP1323-20130603/18984_1 /TAXON_ID=236787 /ORGANISM="Florenciella parvula, Strain RCC1693" /LENGTH=121 /DNA_ID=CAMNT_0024746101 /DNA_START=42 /DNA_END=407 /DNA_ORIENTATION=+
MARLLSLLVALLGASSVTALVPLRSHALSRSTARSHPARPATPATTQIPSRSSVVVEAGDEYAAVETMFSVLRFAGPFALTVIAFDEATGMVSNKPGLLINKATPPAPVAEAMEIAEVAQE